MTELQHEIVKYTHDNMVQLNVYVRDPYVKKYITEEKITEINFVGTIGGLMGLFSGFSFISAVEILYFLFCLSCQNSQAKNEGSSSNKISPMEEDKDGFKKEQPE